MRPEVFTVPTVKPGGSIRKAFAQLAAEEEAWRIQRNGVMRLSQSPRGTTLQADVHPQVFLHPWRCVLGPNRTVFVRAGRVNALPATLKGVRLDGILADGSQGPMPIFSLPNDAGPNEEHESWICAQVQIDLKTGKLVDTKTNPDVVTIVHQDSLDVTYRDGGSKDANGYGIEPLACILWSDDKTPWRIEQVAMHDLHHRYLPPNLIGGRGRHFFFA